ncbi:MAG: type I restriction endonuclease subunit R [Sciscionella sp.]
MAWVVERDVAEVCLEYLQEAGWDVLPGTATAPDADNPERGERRSYQDAILRKRLLAAVSRLNPDLPTAVLDDALDRLSRAESADPLEENLRIHRLVTGGVQLQYADPASGEQRTGLVRLVDFDDPLGNDFLAVSEFTVERADRTGRADLVTFVNGIPLAVFECKRPTGQRADLRAAWRQLQTYAERVPALLAPAAVCVVSNRTDALMGPPLDTFERYASWKTIDGSDVDPRDMSALETLVRGVFDVERFCEYVHDFVAFLRPRGGLEKKIARYHQFDGVRAAVGRAVTAVANPDNKRAGVIWHTQGSGKSLEMLFLAKKLLRHPALGNPTVVVVTDRIDLDEQLFDETFAPAETLPTKPVRVANRAELRETLRTRSSGGIVLTTMQKFGLGKDEFTAGHEFPMLSERDNIVVIADEAHRTQYALKQGLAANLRRALPRAALLAFTGTPIALADRDTQQTFGTVVHTYDVTRAVRDEATVPIYYEARLAKVELPEEARAALDEEFARLTQGEEDDVRDRLGQRWTSMETVVGSEKRIKALATDLIAHWEARSAQLAGKALVVGFSRRICIDLYDEIGRQRPGWCHPDDDRGRVKVVITGDASDGPKYQPHLRSKTQQRVLQERAKDPDDPLELVIVRDMWLTGFDSPPLHTMYVDKPMQGAGLMQAIARVNRRFRDKPSGLVVDYIGIASSLQQALAEYSGRDREQMGIDVEQALAILQQKHRTLSRLLDSCPWRDILDSQGARARLDALAAAVDFLLEQDRTRGNEQPPRDSECTPSEEFRKQAREADRAFSLCNQDPVALGLRRDLAFFDAVAAQLAGVWSRGGAGAGALAEQALRRVVDDAITTEGVVDIYAEAGLARPDIGLITEDLAARMQQRPHKNVQIEALRRLLNDEIGRIGRLNAVAERGFAEQLDATLRRYRNRAITAAEVIAELVALAQKLVAERDRGAALGLSERELAFYDAVAANGSAVQGLGDEKLRAIAHELVSTVRNSATLDWRRREQVRARLRSNVARLLARHGYPPDQADDAVHRVVEQAERLADTDTEGSAG